MVRRGPKKSETLEVRLSYETKTKLVNQAKREGLTVSALVRRLIDGELSDEPNPADPPAFDNSLKAKLMTQIQTLTKHPRLIAGSFASVIAVAMMANSTSMADDVAVELGGTFVEHQNVYSFDHNCTVDLGERCKFDIGQNGEFVVKLNLLTVPDGYEGDVVVEIDVTRFEDIKGVKQSRQITSPVVISNFDENARVEVGTEGGDFYSLTVRAKQVSN